jgi:hypothetical protein
MLYFAIPLKFLMIYKDKVKNNNNNAHYTHRGAVPKLMELSYTHLHSQGNYYYSLFLSYIPTNLLYRCHNVRHQTGHCHLVTVRWQSEDDSARQTCEQIHSKLSNHHTLQCL